jgi:extracellular matrix regulatory protein A
MATRLVHVGFGNYVALDRIRGAEAPASAPIQRLIREGKEEKTTVDLTSGRRTKLVLFMDTGHMFLLGISQKDWTSRSKPGRPGGTRGGPKE